MAFLININTFRFNFGIWHYLLLVYQLFSLMYVMKKHGYTHVILLSGSIYIFYSTGIYFFCKWTGSLKNETWNFHLTEK